MADCGLPQLLIGQAIIPVIGCIRIGVIERPELVIGKCLIRNYISSAHLTKARFANAVHSHLAVENSLHWVLDVSMKEDKCQIYRGNAAEILSGGEKASLEYASC